MDVRELTEELRRKLLSVVFQDFQGYELTLRENVTLGNIEKLEVDKEILDALKLAGGEQDAFLHLYHSGGSFGLDQHYICGGRILGLADTWRRSRRSGIKGLNCYCQERGKIIKLTRPYWIIIIKIV